MVSSKEITTKINSTESGFIECWNILSDIKNGKATGENILKFQTKLIDCLYPIEKLYLKVAHEKRRLKKRKGELNFNWFKKRFNTLSQYGQSLEYILSFGKSFGDAFVWIFYSKEQKLLANHLKTPKIKHLPTGVGGAGEFELVKQLKSYQNHLIIYHGITNILRVGDISFFNLDTRKVTAIGEIKTKKISDNKLDVSVYFTGKRDDVESSFNISSKVPGGSIDLPDRLRQKLQRQFKETVRSLKGNESQKSGDISLGLTHYFNELIELVKNCKTGKCSCQRAGEGLLIFGIKKRKSKLYSKLIGNNKDSTLFNLDNVPDEVQSILKSNPQENILSIGAVQPNQEPDWEILTGTMPLFWCSLDMDVLQKIYFQDVLIFTVYNLGYFIDKLKELGIEINWDRSRRHFHGLKKINGIEVSLHGLDYYKRLIQECLVSEDSVIMIIKRSLDIIEQKKLLKPGTVRFNIHQVLREDYH